MPPSRSPRRVPYHRRHHHPRHFRSTWTPCACLRCIRAAIAHVRIHIRLSHKAPVVRAFYCQQRSSESSVTHAVVLQPAAVLPGTPVASSDLFMALGDSAPATRAPSLGEDFFAFCKDLGILSSGNLDVQQQQHPFSADGAAAASAVEEETGLPVPHMLNDLYGALSAVSDLDLQTSNSFSLQANPSAAAAPSSSAATGGGHHHRAVITAMPFLPNSPTAAVAAVMSAAGVPPPTSLRHTRQGDEDDTVSVDTMPMPHKRRRLTGGLDGGEEASSRPSPNDRAYQPTTTSSSVGGVASHQQQQQQGGAGGGASSAAPASHPNNATPPAQQQAAAAQPPAGLTSTPSGTLKAVLVAKVLTKSDSSSKRIILPRIAVEANLPQVTQGGGHGKTFYFSATDPSGASWPLCIKAWANGQNPKPVYVLEQVGDLMKQQRLGVGDAVAVSASQAGEFYIEWNTEQAKVAAARPTLSTFTFNHAAAAAAVVKGGGGGAAAVKEDQGPQQQQQRVVKQEERAVEVTQQGLVITTSAPLPSPKAGNLEGVASAAVPSVQQQAHSIAAAYPQQQQQQQQQQRVSPFQVQSAAAAAAFQQQQPMVKEEEPWVNSLPQELLSCERVLLPLEHPFDRAFDRPAASRSMFLTIDDSQPSLAEALAGSGVGAVLPLAAAGGSDHAVHAVDATDHDAAALEALMAAEGVVTDEGGAMHQGGFLVCPRTPGCTRAAGHQGWCVGHKGFKKRGRVSPPGPC